MANNIEGIKNQKFGIEIEMTGLTRAMAARVVAQFFETHPWHEGGCYDKYVVTDGTDRKWTLMSDSSISCTHKNGAAAISRQPVSLRTLLVAYTQ